MSRPPLLGGELADRASAALDDLSRALLTVEPERLSDASVATGSSGLGLAHARLSEIFEGRGHDAAAQRAFEHATAAAGATNARPWLFGGAAGIAWAVEQLVDPSEPDAHAALDAKLDAIVSSSDAPYELIQGIAGLAVYTFARWQRPSARALAERIAAWLCARSTRRQGGACWPSLPTREDPSPAFEHNLGLSHGNAGAVLVVAALLERGVASGELRPLLADACAWLRAQELPRDRDAWYPPGAGASEPSRSAWCYGDPGVAWALFVASRALGDTELGAHAIEVARHAAARSVDRTGARDAAFCHGAAGLAHVFRRMCVASDDASLADAARGWIARALQTRVRGAPLAGFRSWKTPRGARPHWSDDATLLNGAAGIALVLANALGRIDDAWDRPMMVV